MTDAKDAARSAEKLLREREQALCDLTQDEWGTPLGAEIRAYGAAARWAALEGAHARMCCCHDFIESLDYSERCFICDDFDINDKVEQHPHVDPRCQAMRDEARKRATEEGA